VFYFKIVLKSLLIKIMNAIVFVFKPRNIQIFGSYYKLSHIYFDISHQSNLKVYLGNGANLKNVKFVVRGKECNVKLGANVKIKNSLIWLEDNACNLYIGDSTTIESANFYITEANSKIIVGNACMFSHDIEFRTGDSHSILDYRTMDRLNPAASIFLGNRVWIAAHVKILKGVVTEDDIIIGLGSIVTSGAKLEKNSIYAGVPAQKIRSGIFWSRKR
jgi:acetyltransferase-like isoleucine patch superfamily enzyme